MSHDINLIVSGQPNKDTHYRQQINKEELLKYFNFLDGNERAIFTCAFLDEESTDVIYGYGVVHGKTSSILQICSSFEQPFTLHTTLNQTNLRGRQTSDIESARVFCIDIDKATTRDTVRQIVKDYSVGMVVESSPGKFHLYWKASPLLDLPKWSYFQMALAAKFDCLLGDGSCDLSLDQVSKTIRVPGVSRVTKEGVSFMPKIVWLNPKVQELNVEAVYKTFGDYNELAAFHAIAKAKKEEQNKLIKEALKCYRAGKDIKAVLADTSSRNVTLYTMLMHELSRASSEFDCMEKAEELAATFNAELPEPLSEREVHTIVKSAYPKAMDRRAAKLQKSRELLGMLDDNKVIGKSVEKPMDTGKIESATEEKNYLTIDLKTFGGYDFKNGLLQENDRYTELGFVNRALARFGDCLLNVEGEVWAFEHSTRTWKEQTANCYPALTTMFDAVVSDVIKEEQFQQQYCLDDGQFSEKKFGIIFSKLRSVQMYARLARGILNSDRLIAVTKSFFDGKAELFNCANGVLNLLDLTLRPAEAKDHLLCRSQVKFEPDATCAFWLKFLGEVFEGSQAIIDFLK